MVYTVNHRKAGVPMQDMSIQNAYEGVLKNISLTIPREKLTVITGLSGSGKSTLAMDVIYMECQRQYLEAMNFQGIQKPKVEAIRYASPAIQIGVTNAQKNPRSTLGTMSNIYTDLRMIYEKLGKQTCPHCHKEVYPFDCKEVVEKQGSEFTVYMHCHACGHKMEKLTRSHFSYNTKVGACSICQGLGHVLHIQKDVVLNDTYSLETGAVVFWEGRYRDYQIEMYEKACGFYNLKYSKDQIVSTFSHAQLTLLLYGSQSEEMKVLFPDKVAIKNTKDGKFEGIYTTLWRRLVDKGGDFKYKSLYFYDETCPACQGERLSEEARKVAIEGKRLPELSTCSLEELLKWILLLEKKYAEKQGDIAIYLLDIRTKMQRLLKVGLGYLSLGRKTLTLSGGELQRIKLAAALDSTITGIIYILDEPTIGLHPQDTEGLIAVMKDLRDLGNTILVIEHDIDVMQAADHIIDMGPASGKQGGEILATGNFQSLLANPKSITGQYFFHKSKQHRIPRTITSQCLSIHEATCHNLKQISIKIPLHVLVSITGVSGSGKSTLLFDVVAKAIQERNTTLLQGSEDIDQMILIEQAPLTRMKRSNVATYCDVFTHIRTLFAKLPQALVQGFTAKHFSFNVSGGRCENCEGLGYVNSNMLFFQDVEISCPQCHGKQFHDDVLKITYQGLHIHDVLKLTIDEALPIFHDQKKIVTTLQLLHDVGLGYIELGQTLTTLSGGEGQRLKLAVELLHSNASHVLYLIDEPTTGLHPIDIENFLVLLQRMVDAGNSVMVVEHNQQLIESSDYIIDMGPQGGIHGGKVIATGTPEQIVQSPDSLTGQYLYK